MASPTAAMPHYISKLPLRTHVEAVGIVHSNDTKRDVLTLTRCVLSFMWPFNCGHMC